MRTEAQKKQPIKKLKRAESIMKKSTHCNLAQAANTQTSQLAMLYTY